MSVTFPRIRDLREDSDKTQAQVAEYLHMKRGVYRRYESGEREIPARERPGEREDPCGLDQLTRWSQRIGTPSPAWR